MPRPAEWKVDTGLRTAGSTQYEPVDKDGLFGDERTKLREVQDVLKQFAPASAYEGDRKLREMGEAMLAQFTGLAKTRYNAGEAQTKLQQTSAYYDHAIEKSKPAHQTDLDKDWIQAMNWSPDGGLIGLLVDLPFVRAGAEDPDRGMGIVDHFLALARHQLAQKVYGDAKKKNEKDLITHKVDFSMAVTDLQQLNVHLDDIVELTKFITASRAQNRHHHVDEEVQRVCAKIGKDVPEVFTAAAAAAAPPSAVPKKRPHGLA